MFSTPKYLRDNTKVEQIKSTFSAFQRDAKLSGKLSGTVKLWKKEGDAKYNMGIGCNIFQDQVLKAIDFFLAIIPYHFDVVHLGKLSAKLPQIYAEL